MSECSYHDQMVAVRRALHQFPEEGWTEFCTTAFIARTLRELGYEVLLGEKIVSRKDCLGRDPVLVAQAIETAKAKGVSDELLAEMQELTGCCALLDTKRPGPTLALRFDMDCNNVQENPDPSHRPSAEGWASQRPNLMHACGHDSHISLGLAIARWVMEHQDELNGKLKIIFQPAEEGVRGAAGVAASGIVDDCDYFLSSHIAMMAKSGEIEVAPVGFLCTTKFDITFKGRPAHAGVEPNAGRNALAAACHAVTQLLGIARHGSGMTRVNVGRIVAGEGRNVIPVNAKLVMEVRGETSEINQYMVEQTQNIVEGVAKSFGVEYHIEKMGEAVDLVNDEELVKMLEDVGTHTKGISKILKGSNFGGSEDATILARRVQAHGGKAAYFVLGSNRPSGHHTANFDIDENSLDVGLAIYAEMLKRLMV